MFQNRGQFESKSCPNRCITDKQEKYGKEFSERIWRHFVFDFWICWPGRDFKMCARGSDSTAAVLALRPTAPLWLSTTHVAKYPAPTDWVTIHPRPMTPRINYDRDTLIWSSDCVGLGNDTARVLPPGPQACVQAGGLDL